MPTVTRARKIVLLAAKSSPSARSWLKADEHGVFEKQVNELLESTKAAAEKLMLSEGAVDDQIATVIALRALNALIAEKKKKR